VKVGCRRRAGLHRWCLAAALAWLCPACAQALSAVDDSGRTHVFEAPPKRVVTLAPSLAELVFAAGAGASLVGTTDLSDFPEPARRIPRIGDAGRLDVERVLTMKPDLVLVWQRGATSREQEQLAAAGIPLFHLEPRRLDDVARAIERLGHLLGSEGVAASTAAELRRSLAALRDRHAAAASVRVFYQVWTRPLMTINGRQLINDVVALCGGRNVFAELAPLVPVVSTEAVVAADPEAMFTASEEGGGAPAWQRRPDDPSFATWQRHRRMSAVRNGWLFTLNGDGISRLGPRIVDGARAMCAALDLVRRERSAGPR
jgi:iron complex transport system substrate-binding protein